MGTGNGGSLGRGLRDAGKVLATITLCVSSAACRDREDPVGPDRPAPDGSAAIARRATRDGRFVVRAVLRAGSSGRIAFRTAVVEMRPGVIAHNKSDALPACCLT